MSCIDSIWLNFWNLKGKNLKSTTSRLGEAFDYKGKNGIHIISPTQISISFCCPCPTIGVGGMGDAAPKVPRDAIDKDLLDAITPRVDNASDLGSPAAGVGGTGSTSPKRPSLAIDSCLLSDTIPSLAIANALLLGLPSLLD